MGVMGGSTRAPPAAGRLNGATAAKLIVAIVGLIVGLIVVSILVPW